ncbi:MAG TPA: universal stress protein [Candidatus Limnocylindrales bacterium]|nr:universal stress protein [Candidatus Limnocylindrales bacterium]
MKKTDAESLETKSPITWKAILVPTDFSERSEEAVKTAIRLAEQCGAKISLLHVAQLPNSGCFEAGTAADVVMDSAREALDEIANEIPTARNGEKLVCFGAWGAFQKIVETAREISADLIVMATHGYGAFKRALLGSAAEYVIRHAPCPVLVVRQKQDYQQTKQAAQLERKI